jgi:hypothetical protein
MIRLGGMSFGFLIFMAVWIYALLDVIQTDGILTRNLPKQIWLLLVVFVPLMGSIAWLVAGRPLYAGWAPGGADNRRPARPRSVEDQPGFASQRPASGPTAEQLQRWEDDLARRERELNRPTDSDDPER